MMAVDLVPRLPAVIPQTVTANLPTTTEAEEETEAIGPKINDSPPQQVTAHEAKPQEKRPITFQENVQDDRLAEAPKKGTTFPQAS